MDGKINDELFFQIYQNFENVIQKGEEAFGKDNFTIAKVTFGSVIHCVFVHEKRSLFDSDSVGSHLNAFGCHIKTFQYRVCVGMEEDKFRRLAQENFVPLLSVDGKINDELFFLLLKANDCASREG